jgi:putative ABC transport system permease protein
MLVLVGIGASTGLLVTVLSISQGVRAAVQNSIDATGADIVIQKRVKPCPFAEVKLPKDLGEIDMSVVETLRELPEVDEASGVLMLWAFHDGHPTVIAGVDPHLKQLGPVRLKHPDEDEDRQTCCAIAEGRYLSGGDDYHTIITEEFAQAKGYSVGQMIPLGPNSLFEVVGIVSLAQSARIAEAEAFVPLKIAQSMYAGGNVVDAIFVALEDGGQDERVQAVARDEIGPEVSITTSANVDAGPAMLAEVTRNTLYVISAVVLVFVFLLILHSFLGNVARRVPEIGILKAIGWSNTEVGRMFVAEALYVGLIGGIVGSALGLVVAWAYSKVATLELPSALASYPPCATTQPMLSTQVIFTPSPTLFLAGAIVALVIGVTAGFAAARKAALLPPAEALRRL